MLGFFSKKETESSSRPDGKIYSCVSCGLYKTCKSPKMQPTGEFKKGILVVGANPTEADDQNGFLFSDKNGRLLSRLLASVDIDLREDCLSVPAVQCFSSEITPYHQSCCAKHLNAVIKKYNPSIIISLGMVPLSMLLQGRWKKDLGTINKWRGWQIPDQDLQAFVCPVLSLDTVKWAKGEEVETVFLQDLQKIAALVGKKFPKNKPAKIDIIEDLRVLNSINPGSIVAIDYETTGLKPHGPDHRIVCAAVADTPDHAYVFFMPETKKQRAPFVKLLANPTIQKTAQNMKFEHAWSTVRLRQPVKGWAWDTMIGTHLLDNRPDITGLKFQTYVQFGVVDYDSDIAPYLKSDNEKNGNALNRIYEVFDKPGGAEKLLTYCAYDTIYEYRLMMLQTDLINYPFLPF